MSNAVVLRDTFDGLAKMEANFKTALPAHIKPEKFIATVKTAITTSGDLQKVCTTKEGRQSLYMSAMKCAQDGLVPDGREAAFVKFGGKGAATVSYMPMVGGLLKAMRNSGEIVSVSARCVFENDKFEYQLGDQEDIIHEPAGMLEEPGAVIGAYCIIHLKDGGVIREVMRKAEIEKVRNVSRAKFGPWNDWYEEMARKTVLRRAYKYAPKSADIDDLFKNDEHNFDIAGAAAVSSSIQGHDASSILNDEPEHDEDGVVEDVVDAEVEDFDIITWMADMGAIIDEAGEDKKMLASIKKQYAAQLKDLEPDFPDEVAEIKKRLG